MSVPIVRRLLERRPTLVVVGAVVSVFAIGWVDRATGDRLSFSLFYLAPVGVAAWTGGLRMGILMSVLAASMSLLGDVGGDGLEAIAPLWNALVRLGVLTTVAIILTRLRGSLEAQRELASTDPLTGVLNPRAFDAVAERELTRALRYGRPLSLAYLDLDGFKRVNDTLGHSVGDRLLRAVADELVARLRPSDVVARVGGDEFAVLMPETSQEDGEAAIERVSAGLVERMQAYGWPASFSAGVATCSGVGSTVDAMIADADALMYEHKALGRDPALTRP